MAKRRSWWTPHQRSVPKPLWERESDSNSPKKAHSARPVNRLRYRCEVISENVIIKETDGGFFLANEPCMIASASTKTFLGAQRPYRPTDIPSCSPKVIWLSPRGLFNCSSRNACTNQFYDGFASKLSSSCSCGAHWLFRIRHTKKLSRAHPNKLPGRSLRNRRTKKYLSHISHSLSSVFLNSILR